MEKYNFAEYTEQAVNYAIYWAEQKRMEFVTPEMILIGITLQKPFNNITKEHFIDPLKIREDLKKYTDEIDVVSSDEEYVLDGSLQLRQMLDFAESAARFSAEHTITVPHIINGILELDESKAKYILNKYFGQNKSYIISLFNEAYDERVSDASREVDNLDWLDDDDDSDDIFSTPTEEWQSLVVCLNDKIKSVKLIGRRKELDRTIQVLCRKEKNNPLHIGESGVGKTALVYGLVAMINSGNVPESLRNSKIYSMDLGTLIAGSQMRGEFEKRIKMIIEGVSKLENGIIYLDEIHNLIGAGQIGDSAMDASSILKPYLDDGKVRFIGSTTYQDYNRYMSKSKGIIRRFQQIDIQEPSVDETIDIIKGLLPEYEKYHGVKYKEDAIRYAVEKSNLYIADRFLPDKAIDIIDEAGAYRKLHPLLKKDNTLKSKRFQFVDVQLISDVLANVCKIDAKVLTDSNNEQLEKLADRIEEQIYGQNEAVKSVVELIQMSKAGLLEDNKPIASLLFVGPTGVGKTELCNVLAKELGIGMVRFDMSEYTERHTVAKLIGSPAGYVGYEDGGLLTDAIRKTPNCVLLLDEIEKAHPDIYNILLQVMDYAKLTDNKGNKADFKNVILVMTSNAGAQYASQSGMGFASKISRGEAMLNTVKKTFKPEFLNRLSGTIAFNDMDERMAKLILEKKIQQLGKRLEEKNVVLELMPNAWEWLLKKGFTKQYGAREIDRTIQKYLNPLLMREILFGDLKNGGKAYVNLVNDKLNIELNK